MENGARLLDALRHFGFAPEPLTASEAVHPDRLIQMGVEPVQIHVMSSITGVTWDDVWSGRMVGPAGDWEVAFIGRAELLRNKRAAGRPKDLADVDALTLPDE